MEKIVLRFKNNVLILQAYIHNTSVFVLVMGKVLQFLIFYFNY